MGNDNHMKNASESFSKGAQRASEHASHGRVIDAVQSAWEGTATAAVELGKSASERISNVADGASKDHDQ
ncbi:MAG: hypothetical protein OWT28_03175 [Firmicutes bacterium]|nr:hypothetical protein [Bacillota bacterium]